MSHMKKWWLALIGLIIIIISYGYSAKSYTEGTEFINIGTTIPNAPRVVEFFSFYCKQCYQFENSYHLSSTIAKNLPKDIKLERYHIDFLGPLGLELTKAWTVARVLKVDDKVSILLFDGIQNKKINTPNDIKAVFLKVGVTSEEYDAALNSGIVKALVVKQKQTMEDFKLIGVPAIFVNGKYLVRHNGIYIKDVNDSTKYVNDYTKAYSDVVNFLLNKH